MIILWEYFKTKMGKIGPLERMLHCVKIDKFKKMTLYIYSLTRGNIFLYSDGFYVSTIEYKTDLNKDVQVSYVRDIFKFINSIRIHIFILYIYINLDNTNIYINVMLPKNLMKYPVVKKCSVTIERVLI